MTDKSWIWTIDFANRRRRSQKNALGRSCRSLPARATTALVALALTAIVGCGDASRVPITGTVFLDGKPLSGCAVLFVPAAKSAQGAAASGTTDNEGRFSLAAANLPGASVGEYCVTVTKQNAKNVVDKATGENRLQIEWLTPAKYSRPETSGIRKTVSSQEHDFTIELSSR